MSAVIIDGKAVASKVENYIRYEVAELMHPPRLTILTDHSDPASEVYMRNKLKAAERCGIKAKVVDLPEEFAWDSLHDFFEWVKSESDAVILQLPIKNKEWEVAIIEMIPTSHDVDGLTALNTGILHKGIRGCCLPCAPYGIVYLLKEYHIPIKGKHAVIVGRSNLVGRPLAEMLLKEDATVTVCHSKTEDLAKHTRQADILVVATGKANLITADMVKPGAAVIDVGINRVDGKLCGDVDFESVKEVAGWITPVPGGVGPMTVAMLMFNTLNAVWP